MPTCTAKEGCTNEAVAQFVWPWGDNGLCCAEHQIVVQQQAHALRQQVSLQALQPGAPLPITREERIAAHATALALGEENAELRATSMDLYRKVEELQASLRTELSKAVALEASLAEARSEVERLRATTGKLRQEAADATTEARRLRTLIPQKLDTPPGRVQE